jgi:hypothetical protein
MTHANVGSLLVFDPTKVKVHERNASSHSKDTVVGIITERGKRETPKIALFLEYLQLDTPSIVTQHLHHSCYKFNPIFFLSVSQITSPRSSSKVGNQPTPKFQKL